MKGAANARKVSNLAAMSIEVTLGDGRKIGWDPETLLNRERAGPDRGEQAEVRVTTFVVDGQKMGRERPSGRDEVAMRIEPAVNRLGAQGARDTQS